MQYKALSFNVPKILNTISPAVKTSLWDTVTLYFDLFVVAGALITMKNVMQYAK